MLNPDPNANDVARAIQLALTPVFLLTGIAGILNVMAGRLARIIDRGRQLTLPPHPRHDDATGIVQVELATLEHRRHLASSAITACTLSLFLVCIVIAALFLEVILQLELKWMVGLFFIGSILALVVGLAYFLRQVHLATRTVRFTISDPHP